MPQNNWTKAGGYQVRCPSGLIALIDQIFTLQQTFKEFWKYANCKKRLKVFCQPRESIRPSSSWVLREYSVDGCLLLTVKLLYLFSQACVDRDKSQPLPTVGLWQGFVLLPPLFVCHMNWISSNSQVNEGFTVRSCRISRLLFVDDLVLHASSEQGLQHTLHRFSVVCNQTAMKISTKKTEVLCLSRKLKAVALQASGNILQQVRLKYRPVTSYGHREGRRVCWEGLNFLNCVQ